MIQNRRFALIFRTGALLFAIAGVLKQIGVFDGQLWLGSFMFYTMQSNLLAIALFGILIIRTSKGLQEGAHGSAGYHSRFEMVCVVNVLVTFVVFWILLVPTVSAEYLWSFENLAIHAVTPLLCLSDYMLFSEPQRLKYRDVYYCTIFPLCFVAFASIAGLAGYVYWMGDDGLPVRFPYFFLDYDRIGYMTIAYIVGILVFFLLLSHGIYLIDRKVRKPRKAVKQNQSLKHFFAAIDAVEGEPITNEDLVNFEQSRVSFKKEFDE
jgi:hypothetical protein